MVSTYDYAESGSNLIDRIDEMNNNWWRENIRVTNPCGEQPLPPYGACSLGSVSLTYFVRYPFTEQAVFDRDEYKEVIPVFTRMLDNMVEVSGLPQQQQRSEIPCKHRHGMGFLGIGNTVTLLQMQYGSTESCAFTEAIAREMVRDDWRIGQKIEGKVLHARYNRYMQRIASVAPERVEELAEVGARFTHQSSITATGTILLSLANNASNGIEPSFAYHYSRNVIREGRKFKEKVDVFSLELLAYRHLVNARATPFAEDPQAKLLDYFISTDEVSPRQHVDVQAAAKIWVDSSISKAANVPPACPYEQLKGIYRYAQERGLKGAQHSASTPPRSRAYWSRTRIWRIPPTVLSSMTAQRWRSKATSRSNTTAEPTPLPICSMRSRKGITASFDRLLPASAGPPTGSLGGG